MILPNWPPRDWRMLLALMLLALVGGGAWLITIWSLDALVTLANATQDIWPLAYFAYGALGLLSVPSLGFAGVVWLKSLTLTLPGGSGASAQGDTEQPSVVTTTRTVVTPADTAA